MESSIIRQQDLPAPSGQDLPPPSGQDLAVPAPSGRLPALALAATGGVALLAAGLLLWHDRAELVFLDMVASALALCF